MTIISKLFPHQTDTRYIELERRIKEREESFRASLPTDVAWSMHWEHMFTFAFQAVRNEKDKSYNANEHFPARAARLGMDYLSRALERGKPSLETRRFLAFLITHQRERLSPWVDQAYGNEPLTAKCLHALVMHLRILTPVKCLMIMNAAPAIQPVEKIRLPGSVVPVPTNTSTPSTVKTPLREYQVASTITRPAMVASKSYDTTTLVTGVN